MLPRAQYPSRPRCRDKTSRIRFRNSQKKYLRTGLTWLWRITTSSIPRFRLRCLFHSCECSTTRCHAQRIFSVCKRSTDLKIKRAQLRQSTQWPHQHWSGAWVSPAIHRQRVRPALQSASINKTHRVKFATIRSQIVSHSAFTTRNCMTRRTNPPHPIQNSGTSPPTPIKWIQTIIRIRLSLAQKHLARTCTWVLTPCKTPTSRKYLTL